MLVQRWASVVAGGPALPRHLVDITCLELPGIMGIGFLK